LQVDHSNAGELYEEGKAAMKASSLPAAIENFKESLKYSPHPKTLELLGECLLAQGNDIEAIIYLSASAGLGSKQFRARFLLAKALSQVGEMSLAIDKLEEALEFKPDYRMAKDLLDALNKQGEINTDAI